MQNISVAQLIAHAIDKADEKHCEKLAYQRCRRKAKKLGIAIKVERDSCGNCYWLENTGWQDEDFCTSWGEVEEKLDFFAARQR